MAKTEVKIINGQNVFTVKPEGETTIRFKTANTYDDKNIMVLIPATIIDSDNI